MLSEDKIELFKNLQTAIELEHSTIPPYLTAFFTIDQETNAFAWNAIRSVVMEEMLHMSLACNIMNAVGGSPSIDNPTFIPEYPTEFNFEDRKFDVGLLKFSKSSIETFMEIEKPEDEKIKIEGEGFKNLMTPIVIDEHTIGEFYEVIKKQLISLVDTYGEDAVFNGDSKNQMSPKEYYGSGGELIEVVCLKSALFAIDIIIEQGEGSSNSVFDGDEEYFNQEKEVAHYFRFNEIFLGKKYKKGDKPNKPPTGPPVLINWNAAKNMIDNPMASHFEKDSPARIKADEFNQLYSYFLQLLHQTFNGQPDLMMKAVGMMYQMKYLAAELLNIKVIGNKEGKVAGPPFEYINPPKRKDFDWVIPELKV